MLLELLQHVASAVWLRLDGARLAMFASHLGLLRSLFGWFDLVVSAKVYEVESVSNTAQFCCCCCCRFFGGNSPQCGCSYNAIMRLPVIFVLLGVCLLFV